LIPCPRPQTVVVPAGPATLNILVKQNTGQISGTVTLPRANNDYNLVHLSLQGPVSKEVDLTSARGFAESFELWILFPGSDVSPTGAQVQTSVAVTNGQTTTLNLDWSCPP